MLLRHFGLALLVFFVFSPAYVVAGASREDPKSEPRKDPREQRAAIEKNRGELGDLKQTQRLLRFVLKQKLAQKKTEAERTATAERKTQVQAPKAEQQAGTSQTAAATPQVQKPAKKIAKPKVLAKTANGKNPHEVFASSEESRENQPADLNEVLLGQLETHLSHQPYYQKFAGRKFETDPGADLVAELMLEARQHGTRSEEVIEAQALARVGDQPEVGYFMSRNASQRASAMRDTVYADTLDNIRRWRRIAMLDPDAEVRAAAALRLDRAGKTLAGKYLRALHPTERRLVGNFDPFDPAAREFLESLANAATGSQVRPGLTPNLQSVASRILEELPLGRPWREDVKLSLDEHKLAPVPAEMSSERAAEMNAAAKAKQAALEPQWNILYDPKAPLEARVAALEDTSVANSPENWKSWVYVGRHDSDVTVQTIAWRRAAEASPAYEFTQNASSLIQILMADIDPLTYEGHRRLLAMVRGEWNFDDRLPEGLPADSNEVPVLRNVANDLLRSYIPRAKTFEEQARLKILTYARDVAASTLEAFDALNLSDAAHAEAELEALVARTPKAFPERSSSDREIHTLARIVLETVVHPPKPGTLRAIVARYLSDESVTLRQLRDPLIEKIWDAADRIEVVADLVAQLKSQFEPSSPAYNFYGSLAKDLDARAHGVDDPDRATPADLALATAAPETEFVAMPIEKIGYDPKDPWAERLAAVKANEISLEDYNGEDSYRRWLGIAFSDENMFVRAEARLKVHAIESDVVELWVNEFFAAQRNSDEHEAFELSRPLRDDSEGAPYPYRNLRDSTVHDDLRAYAKHLEGQEATRDFGMQLHDLLDHFRPYTR